MEPPRARYCAPSSPPGRGGRENKGLRRKGPPGTGSAGGPEETADSRKPKFVSANSRGGGAGSGACRACDEGARPCGDSPLPPRAVPSGPSPCLVPPETGGLSGNTWRYQVQLGFEG